MASCAAIATVMMNLSYYGFAVNTEAYHVLRLLGTTELVEWWQSVELDTYQTSTDIIASNGDVQYYLRQYEPFMMIPISFRLDISSSELRAKA